MQKFVLTHRIYVPSVNDSFSKANSYYQELQNAEVFDLSQDEYNTLRKTGGLFDSYDSAFGTLIDDCEEDRIEEDQVSQAIRITTDYLSKATANEMPAVSKILDSLKLASKNGVFWEIVNGAELRE